MKYFRDIFRERKEVSVRYDPEDQAVWLYLNPKDRPRLSLDLVNSILEVSKSIISYFEKSSVLEKFPIKYYVVASQIKGIFNYGGDLDYFLTLVETSNEEELRKYTNLCVENVYLFDKNLNLPIETISLVQGTALGGGFELVLSTSMIVAEKSAKMGFPESRFNLFPGVGGYTFLAKKYGVKLAEEMITSGKIFTSDLLYQNGIVDEVVEEGEGVDFVKRYMKKRSKNFKSHIALLKARQTHLNITIQELDKIATLWMNMVLNLGNSDIKALRRLVSAQDGKDINSTLKMRTLQDRRLYPEENLTVYDRRKNIYDRRNI